MSGVVARGVRTALLCAWLGSVALVGCAQGNAAIPGEIVKVPPRAVTAGDELMSWAPAGASLVVEIDMARLRANPVVGEAVRALSGLPAPGWNLGLMGGADAVLFCAYDIGSEHAATLTLVRGDNAAAWGFVVGERTAALGPSPLVARVDAVRAGREPSLAEDRALMSVRTRAMPARAEGASLRAAARLDFDARVALAGQLDLDRVPTAISVWGDVADDLAVVAVLQGEDGDEARDLAVAAQRWRDRLAREDWVRARYLHFVLGTIDIARRGTTARLVLIIGPRRLRAMTDRYLRTLSESSP